MSQYDYPDCSQATIKPMSEEQLAERLARKGDRIRYSKGRYWRARPRGFYLPAYSLARLSIDEARRPAPGWGFVAGLDEGSRDAANARIPMHLMSDVASFSDANVTRNTRSARRRLQRLGYRFVVVTDERLLRDQGYDVYREWRQRMGAWVPDREAFVARITEKVRNPAWLIVGALDGDRLMGFTVAWAVDDTAYLDYFAYVDDARKLRLSAVMNYELAAALRNTGVVRQATPGIARPEFPGPTIFKVEQGYPIVHVPARLSILPPVAWYLRARRPLEYYRLTGRTPGREPWSRTGALNGQ
jgi:hypothetical protein